MGGKEAAVDRATGEVLPLPLVDRAVESVVKPVVGIEEAVQIWQQYQALENAVLTDDDYIYFVAYKQGDYDKQARFVNRAEAEKFANNVGGQLIRRKKKSGCRKIATFFNLSVPERQDFKLSTQEVGDYIIQVEQGEGYTLTIYQRRDNLLTVKATCSCTVKANNGRTMIGWGAASLNASRGYSNGDHDIPATAFTRAINRGILDLVGWGEVSAEEIEPDAGGGHNRAGNSGLGGQQGASGVGQQGNGGNQAEVNWNVFWAKIRQWGITKEQIAEVHGSDNLKGMQGPARKELLDKIEARFIKKWESAKDQAPASQGGMSIPETGEGKVIDAEEVPGNGEGTEIKLQNGEPVE